MIAWNCISGERCELAVDLQGFRIGWEGWELELELGDWLVRYHTLCFHFIHRVNNLPCIFYVVVLLLGLYTISIMITQIASQPT